LKSNDIFVERTYNNKQYECFFLLCIKHIEGKIKWFAVHTYRQGLCGVIIYNTFILIHTVISLTKKIARMYRAASVYALPFYAFTRYTCMLRPRFRISVLYLRISVFFFFVRSANKTKQNDADLRPRSEIVIILYDFGTYARCFRFLPRRCCPRVFVCVHKSIEIVKVTAMSVVLLEVCGPDSDNPLHQHQHHRHVPTATIHHLIRLECFHPTRQCQSYTAQKGGQNERGIARGCRSRRAEGKLCPTIGQSRRRHSTQTQRKINKQIK
jgi:hypothetical protein